MPFRTTEMDFYDDGGSLLRETVSAEDIPNFVKSAAVMDESSSPSNLYALVLVEDGDTLKKFATADAGNTWLSTLYFAKNRHVLPIEAQKTAATHLKDALTHFDIEPPEVIEKLAHDDFSHTNMVNVTGKSAPRISRAKSDDIEYALELNDGTKRYPLNGAESVKTALSYFELNKGQFVPRERREYAVKVASVAHRHDMPINDSVAAYAGSEYASSVLGHLNLRKGYLTSPDAVEDLTKLASRSGAVPANQFADELAEFDSKHGLDALWDSYLSDPWKSVLAPLEKVAKGAVETVTFQIGNETVTEADLMNLRKMRKTLVDNFGASFANQYAGDPVSIFKSMPLPQKKVLASLARDVTNSGAY